MTVNRFQSTSRLTRPAARTGLAWVLTGVLFLALAASSPAATVTLGKAGELKYVQAQTSVPATASTRASAHAEARCGAPMWKATGGGAALPGDVAASFLSQVGVGGREVDGGAWHVLQPERQLSVYGICSKSKAVKSSAHIENFLPAPSTLGASVSCAAGHVLGGGAVAPISDSYFDTTISTDGPDADSIPDDGWRTLDTLLDGGGALLIVQDVCRTGPAPKYRGETEQVASGDQRTLRARCNGGHVMGGGVSVTGPADEAHIAVSRPIDGGDADLVPDDGWQATVFNDGPVTETAAVRAICTS